MNHSITTGGHELPRNLRHPNTIRMMLVVEGMNDIEFLHRISLILHAADPDLPNLMELEQQGTLIFVPFGGGHVRAWSERLAPLGLPEFHIYNRELPPETNLRCEAAETVNRRSRCEAVLTNKRSLENYLHPKAVREAGNIEVAFGDFDRVAENVARELYQQQGDERDWQLQTRRARSRMSNRAKRWLSTEAVEQMTVDLLSERDADEEINAWMSTIARMTEV